jgi:hypothetical protein
MVNHPLHDEALDSQARSSAAATSVRYLCTRIVVGTDFGARKTAPNPLSMPGLEKTSDR